LRAAVAEESSDRRKEILRFGPLDIERESRQQIAAVIAAINAAESLALASSSSTAMR
jgi:hypothetical protein